MKKGHSISYCLALGRLSSIIILFYYFFVRSIFLLLKFQFIIFGYCNDWFNVKEGPRMVEAVLPIYVKYGRYGTVEHGMGLYTVYSCLFCFTNPIHKIGEIIVLLPFRTFIWPFLSVHLTFGYGFVAVGLLTNVILGTGGRMRGVDLILPGGSDRDWMVLWEGNCKNFSSVQIYLRKWIY